MTSGWLPSATVVIRTPLLPQTTIAAWTDAAEGDVERLRAGLRTLVDMPEVREALFVASPQLFESLDHWIAKPDSPRGQRVERTLVRYIARMSTRATPFGLFSGVTAGALDDVTDLRVGPRRDYGRQTRLDNDYLFSLCEGLGRVRAIRESLRYSPNSSLYRAAGRLRYAEARLDGKERSYHLVAVEPSDYLERTLERARDGALPEELAAALVADVPDVELDEARAYVDELIDSQLLVSQLTPNVTGVEPIDGALAVLDTVPAAVQATATLRQARSAIADIDRAGAGTAPSAYRAIAASLEALPAPVDLDRLFQVDAIAPYACARISERVVAEVVRGIDILRAMTPARAESPLARFRAAFVARYEGREVPLAEALDEEAGVGFQTAASPLAEASPLLAGLRFPASPRTPTSSAGAREAFLLRRVVEFARSGTREWSLSRADLEELQVRSPPTLPDAIFAMAVIVASSADALNGGEFSLFMPGASGPSGARLLGRFCHASSAIEEGVRAHLRAEEALHPSDVFAEIAHLPEGRIGNILCRPVLREFEIPYLGRSGASRDRQLPLDDLTLSVEGERVVLRSRRLGREVLPRLTSAHNYTARSLGTYRFLCTLQEQDTAAVGWTWGALATAPYLPRVTCGRLVFARAQWRLSKPDLAPLRERSLDAVDALRERAGLPRFVLLVEDDNELLVDLDNPLSVESFVHLVRSRDSVELVEHYPSDDDLIVSGADGKYAHELVFSFVREMSPRALACARRPSESPTEVQRSLTPGSEWLYAKLYCGNASADVVLVDAIGPLVRAALDRGDIRDWFFLRYADPAPHLRVRMRGEPARLLRNVLPELHDAVSSLVSTGLVWRFQLDTYEREIERYGGLAGVELAERLFFFDSEAVLEIVGLLEGDDGQDARWRLAVRGVDMLLDDFGTPLDDKLELARRSRESFDREFLAGTALHRQLGVKYRSEREALAELLARNPDVDAASELAPGYEALVRRSERNADIISKLKAADRRGELVPPLREIIWSYLHMHCNRMLRSAHRAQELVIYDLLRRQYEAQRALRKRDLR